ncbi:MAG TPA: TIM barrel protein [Pelobium sp.]|nr:TIM barrel protein [Pelobium sp.]
MEENRREFLKKLAITTVGITGFFDFAKAFTLTKNDYFKISLAQWSLHQSLFGGKLSNLDFPEKAKKDFDIDIVEYVSVFFNKKEGDKSYLNQLKQRTDDLGVLNHLIMVDGEGDLGNTDEKERQTAVENHYKWVETAKLLGCKSIRVNASGSGSKEDVALAAVDGLGKLTALGKAHNINIIIENHGGYSSDGKWLSGVVREVDSAYCGTLPDFGNFKISATQEYDKYQGVKDLMPFAKGISAKTFAFDKEGNETTIDYNRMFEIIKTAGWRGIVGIEYEGTGLSEDAGIRATKRLLEKIKQGD